MKIIKHFILYTTVTVLLILSFGITVYGAVTEVDLNSGAERGGPYVSVNTVIDTGSGTYKVIAAGLKAENRDQFIQAIKNNYVSGAGDDLRIVDQALPDAEKYDCRHQQDEDSDTYQCWAASASNMLWISGWAGQFTKPNTDEKIFKSEDEVFDYYTTHFSDAGGDIDRAIDWFFMGEYAPVDSNSSTGMLDSNDDTQGLKKEFVSTTAQEQYILTGSPEQIKQLERLDWQGSGKPAVIQGGLGTLSGDEATTDYMHSVTIAGVITDPAASDMKDRYKAVIIIDSDNDGNPTETSDNAEERLRLRAERPNTFTVYDLQYGTDSNGKGYWAVPGFSDDDLYTLNYLDLFMLPPEDGDLDGYIETEGTKNAFETADLTIDILFTTDREESISLLSASRIEEATKIEFIEGEPVNLNYFITNRASVPDDESFEGFGNLKIGWEVVNKADGTIAARGSELFTESVDFHTHVGALIRLNEKDGKQITFKPGDYTLKMTLNEDRAVKESYYLNNGVKEIGFSVSAVPDAGNKDPQKIKPKVVLSKTSYIYNGKVKKPAVTVKYGKKTLSADKYKVTYSSGRRNVGTYKVTVTMRNGYAGEGSASFRIVPKGTSLKRPKALRKAIRVRWTRQTAKMSRSRITGYQIQLATDKGFTKNKKTVTVKGYKRISKKVTGLKAHKKYYVRIRTYKMVNGKKYCSAWSKAKSVKTK